MNAQYQANIMILYTSCVGGRQMQKFIGFSRAKQTELSVSRQSQHAIANDVTDV